MKKLTIIIPVYNVEKYLRTCFDSLVNQTSKDFMAYIVNDGTKDNSQTIIDEYVLKYPELFKSFIKENGGLSDARNYAIPLVETEYIGFIDSDDFVEPDYVSKTIERMDRDKLDFVAFAYNVYEDNKGVIETINRGKEADTVYSIKEDKELLARMSNAAWNKVYKTSLFKENNILYPKGYTQEDLGTTPRLEALSERIGFIKEPLYDYRAGRPDNISNVVDKRVYHVLDMMKTVIDFYKEKKIFETYKEELYFLTYSNIGNMFKKVVYVSDRKFAFDYFDEAFKFLKDNFKNCKDIYDIKKEIGSSIYTSKVLLKAYYIYKHR